MIDLKAIHDLPTLMRWRQEVIEHVFDIVPDKGLLSNNLQYYLTHIDDGRHRAFLANVDGEEAGCGSICITDELPSPDNPSGRCAYLMNIYVREQFRNQGVAHAIVKHLIDEAKNLKCGKIYLETTNEGKSVYTSLGFKDMPDMMKYYDTDN